MFTGEKPDLLDICPLREDSIYVVGKDGIPQHYDGEDWTPVRTGNTNPLMGIWAAYRELRLAQLGLWLRLRTSFHIRGGGARVVLER